jgi:hypothetical protein
MAISADFNKLRRVLFNRNCARLGHTGHNKTEPDFRSPFASVLQIILQLLGILVRNVLVRMADPKLPSPRGLGSCEGETFGIVESNGSHQPVSKWSESPTMLLCPSGSPLSLWKQSRRKDFRRTISGMPQELLEYRRSE